jgi:hypothetical protein
MKVLKNGHCELRCPKDDQKWNGHECVCKDEYVVPRESELLPVELSDRIRVSSHSKKVLKNGHCEYPCPAGQKYNGKQCECEDK